MFSFLRAAMNGFNSPMCWSALRRRANAPSRLGIQLSSDHQQPTYPEDAERLREPVGRGGGKVAGRCGLAAMVGGEVGEVEWVDGAIGTQGPKPRNWVKSDAWSAP